MFSRFKTFIKVIMIGFAITVSIELLQFFLQLGQFDIDDIILNTNGALFDYFVYISISKLWGNLQSVKQKKLSIKKGGIIRPGFTNQYYLACNN